MTPVTELRKGKSYRLVCRGGYTSPGGRGWSINPKPGWDEAPDRVLEVKVRSWFTSITDQRVYQVVDVTEKKGSRATYAVGADSIKSVEEL